jgi:hypothetical protein
MLPVRVQLTNSRTYRLSLQSSESGVAVLVTPEKRYALRQKNTSNALMVLAPSQAPSSSPGLVPGLEVVATVHDTVELVPESGSTKDSSSSAGTRGKWHEKFSKGR